MICLQMLMVSAGLRDRIPVYGITHREFKFKCKFIRIIKFLTINLYKKTTLLLKKIRGFFLLNIFKQNLRVSTHLFTID